MMNWKGLVVAVTKIYPRICLEELSKIENLSQDMLISELRIRHGTFQI
jgi:hypothetical protein